MSLSTTSYETVLVLITANSDAHRIAYYYIYIPYQDRIRPCRPLAYYHAPECTFYFLAELTEYTFLLSACLSDDK